MQPIIPGAYEPNTLTRRQPGAIGSASGDDVPAGPCSMDAATIAEREREGGGAPSERRHPDDVQTRGRRGATASEDAHAERWREWQLGNAVTRRKDATRARLVFTSMCLALAAWFGLQLL